MVMVFAVALTVQQVLIETDYGNAIVDKKNGAAIKVGDTNLTNDPLFPGN